MTNTVAICIATFRRPDGLKTLLDSLAALVFTRVPAPAITVIVVDNDPAASAEATVSAVQAQGFPHILVYACEKTPGIPFARNRCLDLVPDGTGFAVFADDDEWVEPGWLEALLGAQRQFEADAVQGPVLPVLAEDAPAWVRQGRFHDRPNFPEGKQLDTASTNNVLVSMPLVRRLNLRFEESMAMTGGTDTLFFFRARDGGARIVWTNTAVVSEFVPPSRTTVRWLLQRHFRLGNTQSLCDWQLGMTPRRFLLRLAKSGANVLLGASMFVPAIFTGKTGATKAGCRISRGVGMTAGLLRLTYKEYKVNASSASGH